MDAISPMWILIYVCPGTLRVAALITSHNLLFSFMLKVTRKGTVLTQKRLAGLFLLHLLDIQPSSSKNSRSGTWEPCKSGSSEHQKHETSFEHWSEKLSNSMILGQYAVVNSLFNTEPVKGGREWLEKTIFPMITYLKRKTSSCTCAIYHLSFWITKKSGCHFLLCCGISAEIEAWISWSSW